MVSASAKRTLGLGVANHRRINGLSTRNLSRTRRGGLGCLPPHGVAIFHGARGSGWVSPLSSTSPTSVGSHHVRNVDDVTTFAFAFCRTRPDAPKWSMCECVTTTVCTFFSWKPANWNRSISSFHACGPGMPGSTMVKPFSSSSA
jgi:hypothetical protein